MEDHTTEPHQKFKSRTDDELGVHVLEDIAEHGAAYTEWCVKTFNSIAEKIEAIDGLMTLDERQGAAMKMSKGAVAYVLMDTARKVTWHTKAFRDPVRLNALTEENTLVFSEAYLRAVDNLFGEILTTLEKTNAGSPADLACNKALREHYIAPLREISHQLDFQLVYNVFADSNLSGDASKPDWHELVERGGPKRPPRGPGGGPNNGGTPKGALVPFPSLMTDATARAA